LLPQSRSLPELSLTNQDGQTSRSTSSEQWSLLCFRFFCPDICPYSRPPTARPVAAESHEQAAYRAGDYHRDAGQLKYLDYFDADLSADG
jgi:protein SCO1/2